VNVPRVNIEVKKVDKEEFKNRYYLVVYPQKGPSIVMDSFGRKIVIFAGPEEGESGLPSSGGVRLEEKLTTLPAG
jgi:hypothetical protein